MIDAFIEHLIAHFNVGAVGIVLAMIGASVYAWYEYTAPSEPIGKGPWWWHKRRNKFREKTRWETVDECGKPLDTCRDCTHFGGLPTWKHSFGLCEKTGKERSEYRLVCEQFNKEEKDD